MAVTQFKNFLPRVVSFYDAKDPEYWMSNIPKYPCGFFSSSEQKFQHDKLAPLMNSKNGDVANFAKEYCQAMMNFAGGGGFPGHSRTKMAELGQKYKLITGYDNNKNPIYVKEIDDRLKDWGKNDPSFASAGFKSMMEAVSQKIKDNPALSQKLQKLPPDAIITEAFDEKVIQEKGIKRDSRWADGGAKNDGENLLGIIWTYQLRKAHNLPADLNNIKKEYEDFKQYRSQNQKNKNGDFYDFEKQDGIVKNAPSNFQQQSQQYQPPQPSNTQPDLINKIGKALQTAGVKPNKVEDGVKFNEVWISFGNKTDRDNAFVKLNNKYPNLFTKSTKKDKTINLAYNNIPNFLNSSVDPSVNKKINPVNNTFQQPQYQQSQQNLNNNNLNTIPKKSITTESFGKLDEFIDACEQCGVLFDQNEKIPFISRNTGTNTKGENWDQIWIECKDEVQRNKVFGLLNKTGSFYTNSNHKKTIYIDTKDVLAFLNGVNQPKQQNNNFYNTNNTTNTQTDKTQQIESALNKIGIFTKKEFTRIDVEFDNQRKCYYIKCLGNPTADLTLFPNDKENQKAFVLKTLEQNGLDNLFKENTHPNFSSFTINLPESNVDSFINTVEKMNNNNNNFKSIPTKPFGKLDEFTKDLNKKNHSYLFKKNNNEVKEIPIPPQNDDQKNAVNQCNKALQGVMNQVSKEEPKPTSSFTIYVIDKKTRKVLCEFRYPSRSSINKIDAFIQDPKINPGKQLDCLKQYLPILQGLTPEYPAGCLPSPTLGESGNKSNEPQKNQEDEDDFSPYEQQNKNNF